MTVLVAERALDDVLSRRGDGILIEDVSHTYNGQTGPTVALANIDLAVARGEFVAILGPSGCGKSTLLRIVSGLLGPTAGRVLLDGDTPATARRKRAIGWLAQDDGLLPWRSVLDNLLLPFRIAGQRDQHSLATARKLLADVGLAGSARQYPYELSGGMRQRAALARALVAQPPVVLLDEPYAHLDELTREHLGELLLDLRAGADAPTTTLMVTHSVSEAVRLADRVVVLSPRPGSIRLDIPIDLAHPRGGAHPAFGELVYELKQSLRDAA